MNIQKISSTIIVLVFVTATALYAWTGPTATAPSGNTSAPINVSSSMQDKSGIIRTIGFKSFGQVAIATSTTDTYALPISLLLGVNGKVGASEYCDQSGNNCTSSSGFGGVPAGAVMAFNLASCPAGWVLSDGSNGTRDLRGMFVRGFGTSTDGTASGAFGQKQNDAFASHNHSATVSTGGAHTHSYVTFTASGVDAAAGTNDSNNEGSNTVQTGSSGNHSHTVTISNTGGTETRPDNVALLYCQKS